ncbi:hypothetical protein [Candidatus Sororendozoicomonas aggregata]|uniref:hypothetical protein n=1 Tax=Candidatus Sororendozoicomonas aggregata TaxID=3073239 RepID=UPI002ED3EC9D
MFSLVAKCFPQCTSGSSLLSDEPYSLFGPADSTGLSAVNGECSTAFRHHLIQIINEKIKTAEPKGSGMSLNMRANIKSNIKYFIGSKQVYFDCSDDKQLDERFNRLVGNHQYQWVEENIEDLSTFLHGGFVNSIFSAQNRTGEWLFNGNNIIGIGLTDDYFMSFMICPEQVIRVIIRSNVTNVSVDNGQFWTENSSMINFSIKLTLRFRVIDTVSGPRLQACFDPDDCFGNLWFVEALPTLVESLTFSHW